MTAFIVNNNYLAYIYYLFTWHTRKEQFSWRV